MSIRNCFLAAIALILVPISGASAGVVFSENFGSIADGDDITTSNTNFDYRRIGSGGGQIAAISPGSFGGSSMNLGGSTSGSLNGVGLSSGLGNLNEVAFEFDFRTGDPTLGDLVVTTGAGSSFSGNGTFNTSQLFFGIQSNNGVLQYRTSSWQDAGLTLAANTDYSVDIFANNSGASRDHLFGSVANGTMDIVINGVVIADDVSFANNVAADGLRFYQVTGGQSFEIDNIRVSDTIAVPEPSSMFLIAGLGAVGLVRRRRE